MLKRLVILLLMIKQSVTVGLWERRAGQKRWINSAAPFRVTPPLIVQGR